MLTVIQDKHRDKVKALRSPGLKTIEILVKSDQNLPKLHKAIEIHRSPWIWPGAGATTRIYRVLHGCGTCSAICVWLLVDQSWGMSTSLLPGAAPVTNRWARLSLTGPASGSGPCKKPVGRCKPARRILTGPASGSGPAPRALRAVAGRGGGFLWGLLPGAAPVTNRWARLSLTGPASGSAACQEPLGRCKPAPVDSYGD